jgi:hypothetical protein
MQRKGNPQPLRYRQARLRVIPKPKEPLIKKGGTPNLSMIEGCLKTLRANASVQIDNIPKGEVADCWEQVTIAIGLMENSSFYDTLFEMIKNNFSDLTNPIPGTIGGYFAGCLIGPTNYPVPIGCTPLCLNAAAPSSSYALDNNITPCADTVIVASLINGSYTFTSLNEGSSSNAIIYITQPTFNGLTQNEKTKLEEQFPKVKEVTVISTANNSYKALVAKTPIDKLPTRSVSMWEGIPTGSDPAIGSSNIGWVLLAIVIIFIIVAAIWWYRSKRSE